MSLNAKLTITKATSSPFRSGILDAYAPKRNDMRAAEWEWRYGQVRESVPPREVAKDMRKTVAAILARRAC